MEHIPFCTEAKNWQNQLSKLEAELYLVGTP